MLMLNKQFKYLLKRDFQEMKKNFFALIISCFFCHSAAAGDHLPFGLYLNMHGGASSNLTGQSQQVNVNLLPSANYTLSSRQYWNGVVGLSLLKDVQFQQKEMSYGLGAFYFFPSTVSGNIYQAGLYNNLSYTYLTYNIPIYALAKTTFEFSKLPTPIFFDVGIGPNLLLISNYSEQIINPDSLPDNAFGSSTNISFSVTAGAGIHMDKIIPNHPLECGYRFFYLGSGLLALNNNQYLNKLGTGQIFSNSILCSIKI